jgi:hypothetical protein
MNEKSSGGVVIAIIALVIVLPFVLFVSPAITKILLVNDADCEFFDVVVWCLGSATAWFWSALVWTIVSGMMRFSWISGICAVIALVAGVWCMVRPSIPGKDCILVEISTMECKDSDQIRHLRNMTYWSADGKLLVVDGWAFDTSTWKLVDETLLPDQVHFSIDGKYVWKDLKSNDFNGYLIGDFKIPRLYEGALSTYNNHNGEMVLGVAIERLYRILYINRSYYLSVTDIASGKEISRTVFENLRTEEWGSMPNFKLSPLGFVAYEGQKKYEDSTGSFRCIYIIDDLATYSPRFFCEGYYKFEFMGQSAMVIENSTKIDIKTGQKTGLPAGYISSSKDGNRVMCSSGEVFDIALNKVIFHAGELRRCKRIGKYGVLHDFILSPDGTKVVKCHNWGFTVWQIP